MSKKLICLASFILVLGLVTVAAGADALVGHWSFDEAAGTTAIDSSGNGNNGTLQGNPQWVAGFVGGGLELNGTTDYVDCGSDSSLDITDEIAIAAWLKIDVFGDWDGIVTKGIEQSPYAMQIWGDGSLRFSANWGAPAGGLGSGTWNTNTKMETGEWVHAAVTYDGSTLRFYIDGQQDSLEVTQALTFGTVAESLVLGCDFPGGDEYFDGVMDDVRIYDRGLTAAQALDLYNGIAPVWTKAEDPDPADGALLGALGTSLSWTAGGTAASHNVYFGTDYAEVEAGTGDTFRGNQTAIYFLAGYGYMPNDPCPTGFVPGTTYYWRVDEVEADGVTKHTGDVWSFEVADTKAYAPTPPEGSTFIDPNVDLSWKLGFGAIEQTVYFGDDYDTVSTATTGGTGVGGGITYDPGPLEIETVYYWRVDTFSAYGLITGDVWSFRTVPVIPITDPNLVGWWKFDEGQGSVALDWSGHDNHGTLVGDPQWVAGYDGGALGFDGADDYVEVPQLVQDDFTIAFWVKTTQTGGTGLWYQGVGLVDAEMPGVTTDFGVVLSGSNAGFGMGAVDTTITSTTNINDGTWHHVAATRIGSSGLMRIYVDGRLENSGTGPTETRTAPPRITIGMIQTSFNYFSGQIDDVRIYTRTLTQQEVKETMRGDPLLAWDPNPTNGSTPDIDVAMPLSWSPGDNASGHDVYFGTDEDAVEYADISDTTGIYRIRQSGTSYTPGEGVEWGGGPYYWRIDEYNTDATVSKGRVWSFTVADFINIDNIESYDAVNQIWYNWVDGLGYVKPDEPANPGNGSGSEVGDGTTASFTEETIVHGGAQSMPFKYDNNDPFKLKYSEAKLTLSATRDWTKQDVKALSLWFQGYPASVGSFTDNFDDTYSMTGSGADIWNLGPGEGQYYDEFHYAYKQLTGAGTIVARIDSVSDTHATAKAGVMIRETLDPNSAHAMMVVTPSAGIKFEGRPSTGAASFSYIQSGITAPHWVRLERDMAGYFTVSHSTDGSTWVPVEGAIAQNIPMNTNVYVGLALTSHDADLTCEATFSNVTMTGAVSGQWASQDIGIQSNDPEPMYVAIANNTGAPAVVYHDNPNAAQIDDWMEWNIDLRDFAGINLTDVNSIAVGLGNRNNPQAGGAGKMYFDDIALYRPRYVPDKGTPLAADLNNDGVVDYRDLEVMAGDWLKTDYFTAATVPSGSPVGWWKFENNTNDSAGTNHGTAHGSPGYVASVDGQAISLDGVNDYVSLPIGSVIESLTNSTFTTWVDFSNAGGAWQRIFDFGNNTTTYMFLTPRIGTTEPMRFGITIEGGGAPEQLATAPSTLPSGWHHVAVTINADTNTSTLYLDGLVVASNNAATLTPSDLGNTNNNWLGRSQYSADAYLNGVLDDFRIYDHVLTDAEIAGLVDDTPGDGQLYVQVPSPANIYDDEPQGSRSVNFKDYAVLADQWLDEQLWP